MHVCSKSIFIDNLQQKIGPIGETFESASPAGVKSCIAMKRLFLLLTALLAPSLASENEFTSDASSEVSGEAVQQLNYEALSQGSLLAPSVDAGLSSPPLSGAEPTGVPGKESSPGSQQQLVPPNSSPFNGLPNDLKLQILQLIPLKYSSVCHAGNQSTRKARLTELGRLSVEINKLEGSYESEKERDQELTRRIITEYNEMVKQNQEARAGCIEAESLDLLTRIQDKLEKSQLIKVLPTLSSLTMWYRLSEILGATGSFIGLPLAVRQFISKRTWPAWGCTHQRIGSLSSFLSLYHDDIDKFKDSLIYVDPEVVAEACFKILLNIDSEWLSVEERKEFLASIRSVFPTDSLPAMVCSLRNVLSFESSMSAILEAMEFMDARLVTIMTAVLQSSPAYVTANWCMTKLRRSPFLLILDNSNLHYHLLFNGGFRRQHGISDDDQSLLLESCQPEDLLRGVLSSLTGLDTQALVKWANIHCDFSTLTLPAAVALYSLDDDDQNVLFKYFPSPQNVNLPAFATVAFQLEYAQHLSGEKRDALLKRLSPEHASTFDANDEKHRKALIVQVMSSFNGPVSEAFFSSPFNWDFLLWVEACLDRQEVCQLPAQFDDQRKRRVALKLAQSIGDDVNKVANLQKLPMYYQVMVFLLTDCDRVVAFLSESLNKADVMLHFVDHWHRWGFNSHKEARRAARRAYELCQSLLSELGIE